MNNNKPVHRPVFTGWPCNYILHASHVALNFVKLKADSSQNSGRGLWSNIFIKLQDNRLLLMYPTAKEKNWRKRTLACVQARLFFLLNILDSFPIKNWIKLLRVSGKTYGAASPPASCLLVTKAISTLKSQLFWLNLPNLKGIVVVILWFTKFSQWNYIVYARRNENSRVLIFCWK